MSDNQVRFIRVNGRVVPIKGGKGGQQQKAAKAADKPQKKQKTTSAAAPLFFAGWGSTIAGASVGKAFVNDANTKELFKPGAAKEAAQKFEGMYKKDIPKKFSVMSHGFGMNSDYMTVTTGQGPLLRSGLIKRFINVSSLADEGIFTHELGHAKKSLEKGSWNYKLRADTLKTMRKPKSNGAILRNLTYRPYLRLAAETEASIDAVKTLKGRYGLKGALKKSKMMALGQATYWAVIGGQTAMAAGAGMAIFGGKKKEPKK